MATVAPEIATDSPFTVATAVPTAQVGTRSVSVIGDTRSLLGEMTIFSSNG